MNIRRRMLPEGWYPSDSRVVEELFKDWEQSLPADEGGACAVIVPHAGWHYSGRTAFRTYRTLVKNAELVIAAGGHLGSGSGLYAALEDAFSVPSGFIAADDHFREAALNKFHFTQDRAADNTVEIQLPFIKYFFPDAKLAYVRLPPALSAAEFGVFAAEYAQTENKKCVFIASTDLTHYGPDYGFYPKGVNKDAYEWVETVNDRKIIDAFIDMDIQKALHAAEEDRSACSAGAAAAAVAFAAAGGVKAGRLIEYANSYQLSPGRNFVGYAGIAF